MSNYNWNRRIRHNYYIADVGFGPDGAYALMLPREERDISNQNLGFKILIDQNSPLRSIRGFVRDARQLGIDVCFPLEGSELLYDVKNHTWIEEHTLEGDFKLYLDVLAAYFTRDKEKKHRANKIPYQNSPGLA